MAIRIGILEYPGAQASAVLGLRDLLDQAARLHRQRGGEGLDTRVLQGLGEPEAPLAALILPPALGGEPAEDPLRQAWLLARHGEGTLLCSVCMGGMVLAETGLLDGRPATTHWGLRERFAQRFPRVRLDTDRILIDDGDLLTAGGLMAWVDLGLKLVNRFLGPEAMLATARQLLVDPGGREQRFYSTFAPVLTHGDPAVLAVQAWLQIHFGEKVDAPAMAAAARLGERTFLRRFRRATGLRPTDYLQHLRVSKARELLERPGLAVDEIAWRVGYGDPGAFRKIFLRLMGLTPGDYRRRFAVAGR
ncbi:GlxA family transcriptional regulator [Mesoterricola silvestris]|uniref:Transcriptional regulator n=1 Tax=Mesoterricola silvestris TaxID=2927979 RepID=A0AA48K931_9BACT|nr:helix-turn-helix domain-containing protein [Mesoterricola silvestris]BDU71902.1 transcriptional regulator [Mesoterricola silvestris]